MIENIKIYCLKEENNREIAKISNLLTKISEQKPIEDFVLEIKHPANETDLESEIYSQIEEMIIKDYQSRKQTIETKDLAPLVEESVNIIKQCMSQPDRREIKIGNLIYTWENK